MGIIAVTMVLIVIIDGIKTVASRYLKSKIENRVFLKQFKFFLIMKVTFKESMLLTTY